MSTSEGNVEKTKESKTKNLVIKLNKELYIKARRRSDE